MLGKFREYLLVTSHLSVVVQIPSVTQPHDGLEKNGTVSLAGSAENHLPMGAVKVLFGLESYDIAPAVF
jgi:hypothetical protein